MALQSTAKLVTLGALFTLDSVGCGGSVVVALPVATDEVAIVAVEGGDGQLVGAPMISDGRPTELPFSTAQRLVVMVYSNNTLVASGRPVTDCVVAGRGDLEPRPLRRYLSGRFDGGDLELLEIEPGDSFPQLIMLDPTCVEPSFCRDLQSSVSLMTGASRAYAVMAPVDDRRALLFGGGSARDTYVARLDGEELTEQPPDPSLPREPEEAVFDGRERAVVVMGSARPNVVVFDAEGRALGNLGITLSGAARSLSAGLDGSVFAAAHSGLYEVVGSTVAVRLSPPEQPEEVAHLDRRRLILLGDSRAIHSFDGDRWSVILEPNLLAGLRRIAISEAVVVAATAGGPLFVRSSGPDFEIVTPPLTAKRLLVLGSSIITIGAGLAISNPAFDTWCEPLPDGLVPTHGGLVGRLLWVLLQRPEGASEVDPFMAKLVIPE